MSRLPFCWICLDAYTKSQPQPPLQQSSVSIADATITTSATTALPEAIIVANNTTQSMSDTLPALHNTIPAHLANVVVGTIISPEPTVLGTLVPTVISSRARIANTLHDHLCEKCKLIIHDLLRDETEQYIDFLTLLLEAKNASTNTNADAHLEHVRNMIEIGAAKLFTTNHNVNYLNIAIHIHSKTLVHFELVKLLVESGANVNDGYDGKCLPLFVSVRTIYNIAENIKVTNLLLDHGANINARDKDNCTPLKYAPLKKGVAVIDALINRGADVNDVDTGINLLMSFASYAHRLPKCDEKEKVTAYIMSKCDINAIIKDDTALSRAVRQRNLDGVALLLDNGANTEIASQNVTALSVALAIRNSSTDIIKLLLDRGANINNMTTSVSTIACAICTFKREGQFGITIRPDCIEILELIKNYSPDINIKTRKGYTVLMNILCSPTITETYNFEQHIATNFDMLVKLITYLSATPEYNTCINATDNDNNTAFMLFIKHIVNYRKQNYDHVRPVEEKFTEIIKLLIKCNANINIPDKDGNTPFAHIISNSYYVINMVNSTLCEINMINMMVAHGANVNTPNNDGITPLMACIINNNLGCGHRNNNFVCHDIITMLANSGADINAIDKSGNNALLHALNTCSNCTFDIVKYLIHLRINHNIKNNAGHGPLMVAIKKMDDRSKDHNYLPTRTNDEKMMEYLLNLPNYDINECDNDGNTALIHAFNSRFDRYATCHIIVELIKHGANVNVTDKDGRSPMMILLTEMNSKKYDIDIVKSDDYDKVISIDCAKNVMDIIMLLVDGGADINTTDSRKNNALITVMKKFIAHSENIGKCNATVKRLLLAGIDANATDNAGYDGMTYAKLDGRECMGEIIRTLETLIPKTAKNDKNDKNDKDVIEKMKNDIAIMMRTIVSMDREMKELQASNEQLKSDMCKLATVPAHHIDPTTATQ